MSNNISYIPNGPKNLAPLFPTIDFSNISEYYLEVLDSSNNVIATTTVNELGCCCDYSKVRIHFLNYLGTFDSINFLKPRIVHETESKEYQKSLSLVLDKTEGVSKRFNVVSNDIYETRTNCYGEEAMLWLQELADSPMAFVERKGTQGQQDYFLPIVVTSKKFEKQKNQNEFRYDFVIEFKLANNFIVIRN